MLKNDYLLAKFGVDTAENEPLRARNRARTNIDRSRGVARAVACIVGPLPDARTAG